MAVKHQHYYYIRWSLVNTINHCPTMMIKSLIKKIIISMIMMIRDTSIDNDLFHNKKCTLFFWQSNLFSPISYLKIRYSPGNHFLTLAVRPLRKLHILLLEQNYNDLPFVVVVVIIVVLAHVLLLLLLLDHTLVSSDLLR